jgi:protein-S-isoprenylcysteine O-methyltransferase Ste14
MKSLRQKLFTLRGYTPLPFLAAMVLFARPTAATMAVGFFAVLTGETVRFWGVVYAGRLTRVTGSVGAPEIIVAGPFAYVRNPLYIGNIIAYVGIGIMANALVPWLVLAAAVWFAFQYYQIVLLEEEFLEKEFGEEYATFKKNVPRFIPRWKAYVPEIRKRQPPKWREALRSERRTFQALVIVCAALLVLWYVR